MILIIDSCQEEKIALKSQKFFREKKINGRKSEKLLTTIAQLIKKEKNSLEKISGIIVNSGPGHYTSTRIGVSVANALAFAFKIPIAGVKKPKNFFDLIERGNQGLKKSKNFIPARPYYPIKS